MCVHDRYCWRVLLVENRKQSKLFTEVCSMLELSVVVPKMVIKVSNTRKAKLWMEIEEAYN